MKTSARYLVASVALAAVAIASAGCASGAVEPEATPASADEAVPHGFVEGAAEHEEPQLGLVAVDDSGRVTQVDLATAEVQELGSIDAATSYSADGRYVAAASDDTVSLIDSGVWTVPHGDHSHYYRAAPRIIGEVMLSEAGTGVSLHTTESIAVLTAPETGEVLVLDAEQLGSGLIQERGRWEGGARSAVPLQDAVVVAAGDEVQVFDPAGAAVGAATSCEQAGGAIATNVGVAVSCRDGAVLVTEGDEPAETIAYPDGVAETDRAEAFSARPGRPTVAAVAGADGAWLLSTRERGWTRLSTGEPLQVVTAVDDSDGHVVAITAGGDLVVLTEDGTEVGRREALLPPADETGEPPVIEVDASRAYVSTGGEIIEIDYADAAREARSFPLAAEFVAEVGR